MGNVRGSLTVFLKKNATVKKWMVPLLLPAIFSCSKSTDISKFAGTWNGSYHSAIIMTQPEDVDTGTLQIIVDARNQATGILQSIRGGNPSTLTGSVDPSAGTISINKYAVGNGGSMIFLAGLSGNLSLDSGSGTLTFPWASISHWQVTKH